ncbi:MAG: DUF2188 domain-containing protein [Candidatus Brocadiia bacterium]
MAKRKRYYVNPRPDGKWEVKAEGASRASSVHDRKQDAVQQGRQIARRHRPSQLIIKKQDGTIQAEYTYGKDPYPPRG